MDYMLLILAPIWTILRNHKRRGMARIDKLEAADPKRREDLKVALEAGAFRLGAGCRLLRQLHGLSQADLAAMLGVNLKVIKALESGKGNPGLASIEKIAEAFGLAVVFVKKDTVAEILDGEARAREKARSREADVEALAAGRLSEHELNAKNALKVGHVGFKIPPP
jgi:transcriptional regulator with XRE-family HTH domain